MVPWLSYVVYSEPCGGLLVSSSWSLPHSSTASRHQSRAGPQCWPVPGGRQEPGETEDRRPGSPACPGPRPAWPDSPGLNRQSFTGVISDFGQRVIKVSRKSDPCCAKRPSELSICLDGAVCVRVAGPGRRGNDRSEGRAGFSAA